MSCVLIHIFQLLHTRTMHVDFLLNDFFDFIGQSSPGWLTILIGVLSLFVLLLPLDGESSSWPDWIHVTINMKLIASFVLGNNGKICQVNSSLDVMVMFTSLELTNGS